jgi:multicomponent Na+:H+ antiporter subunit B
MTVIVRSSANFLYPFVMTYGFYIVLHGHLTPGGGFQGGAVIATGVALMLVANRFHEIIKIFKHGLFNLCEQAGLLIFVALGLSALWRGHGFLHNWLAGLGGFLGSPVAYGINHGELNTGGLIPLLNIVIGLEVLGALSLIIYYMMKFVSEDEKGEIRGS